MIFKVHFQDKVEEIKPVSFHCMQQIKHLCCVMSCVLIGLGSNKFGIHPASKQQALQESVGGMLHVIIM